MTTGTAIDPQEVERIATAIKSRARAVDVTMTQLAEDIGMKRSVFYNRLKGVSDWRLSELAAIALRLGASIEDIYYDNPFRASDLRRPPPQQSVVLIEAIEAA